MSKNPLADRPYRGFSSSGFSFSPSGQLWPNGEFSLGYLRRPGDERLDLRHPADNPQGIAPKEGGEGAPPLLILSYPINSHKTRSPRGSMGITSYGKRMLRSACYQVGRDYPRNRPTFCTLTLPPMPLPNRQQISANWGEVVRQVIQYLSRRLVASGLPPIVISCSEFQPDRLARGEGAYLHLHLVWINPVKFGQWAVDTSALREWFTALVERQAECRLESECRVETALARGNIAYEMAKYLSKGCPTLAAAEKDLGPGNLPHTYWNMSGPTRQKIHAELKKGVPVGEALEQFIAYGFHAHELNGLFLWLRHIEADLGGTLVTVGYCGMLTPSVRSDLHDLLSVNPP